MASTESICPSCSAPQAAPANYCPNCGFAVRGGPDSARNERHVRQAKNLILFGYCLVVAGLPLQGPTGSYMLALGFVAVFGGCQWLAMQ